MPRFAAFLRGVNVGGKNKLPMKDLVALFEKAGATDVRTYVQSGNVVFDAPARAAGGLAASITQLVATKFGHAPVVILRTKDELEAAIEANPFLARNPDLGRLHVMFLADEPAAERAASLDPNRSPGDEYALAGRDIYLYLPGGVATSKLTNAYFDAKLKTVSTGRNWRTVTSVSEMMHTTPRKI